MKEIKVENHVNIYPDAQDEMSDEEFLEFRQKVSSTSVIASFPSGSVAMLGFTFSVERAERWHFALGRAIELAGGWKNDV